MTEPVVKWRGFVSRLVNKRYMVKDVSNAKCWVTLELKNGEYISLHKLKTDQSLAYETIGRTIKVRRSEEPPLPNSFIESVYFQGQKIYPV